MAEATSKYAISDGVQILQEILNQGEHSVALASIWLPK